MTATAGRPAEIVSLTTLRGLLAVWVVLYHYWTDVLRLFPTATVVSPAVRAGHLAVPAFFMLSGFVLTYTYGDEFRHPSRRGVVAFLRARLARVYPVHLATLLVVAAMVGVSARIGLRVTDAGYTARDFVLNLVLAQTWVPHFALNWNYPSWSISSEWFAYVLFPFVAAGGTRLRLDRPAGAAVVGAATLAGSVGVILWWRPWPFYELVLVVPTFACGMAVGWLHRSVRLGGPAARWTAAGLAAGVAAACHAPSGEVAAGLAVVLLFALVAVLAWTGGRGHRVWTARPLVYVGTVSYSLYMTHTLAQKLVNGLVPAARSAGADPAVKVGALVGYAVLVVAACLACYYLVEKPCRERFRRTGREADPRRATDQPVREGVPCHTAN